MNMNSYVLRIGFFLLATVTFVACGGDDAGSDASKMDASADTSADGAAQTGTLTTPATVTMGDASGVPLKIAHICQNLVIGGGVGFSLVQGGGLSTCPGGAAYLSFYLNTDTSMYKVTAGEVLDETGGGDNTTISIKSTTMGTLKAAMDAVDPVPADTDVTLTTDDRTVTFQFSGNDVTISAFTKL